MFHPKINFSKKPINDLSADILFNYANTDFVPMATGSFKRLLDVDPSLIRECSNTNIKSGTASMLQSGLLPYKMVCHFAISGIGNDPTEMSIRNAMRWGFQLVSEGQFSTYVLPTLFEEAGGMPCHMCASVILREAIVFSDNFFVQNIIIQTSDKEVYKEYVTVMKSFMKQ